MCADLVKTICPFCGVGCGMCLKINEQGQLLSVEPQQNHPISQGKLCEKGWSTPYAINTNERITQPLKRINKKFYPISWQEALTTIACELTSIIDESGSQTVGIISSARASNEDNYAAQKFARAVLKTNNIDHCARICHSPTVAGLKQSLGSGAMTNSAKDIFDTDLILVFGADPTENHSILGGHIMQAHAQGTELIVVDPRVTRLAKLTSMHLQLKLGSNIALINALLHVIIKEQWFDKNFISSRTQGFEQLALHVKDITPESVESITGVSAELIRTTARAYSQAKRAMIFYGMGITQYVSGTNNVISLANLALSCGHIGKVGTGVNPLRGQNNVQGACDMGCLPNVFPGYQGVAELESQEKFSNAWGAKIAQQPGLTSLGMTKAAQSGDFHALLLFGEDPVVTDPDQNHVKSSLKNLDLLVVAELTMTETAKLADIILPAASFAEKDGTFTNCERRVQKVNQALAPRGEAKGDWQWLQALAKQMGSQLLNWQNSEEVFNEMASLTPDYQAMTYQKISDNSGLQWPCTFDAPEGTSILHQQTFPIGRARFICVNHVDIDEPIDDLFPLLLTTNRLHFHYGCGSMTRKSPLLERETPPGLLFINPIDAQALDITHQAPVSIKSRRGYVETRAMLSDDVPVGLVAMPYHFKEAPSNQLTNTAQDPVTKMPELKACAVVVTPLAKGQPPKTIQQLQGEQ
ncbi:MULTISPECIES: formate dehydrogenase subunit alpha [unclassified Colwellia]|uniref:formate dehydrogenase subunit alpha n=1 Tax=unclassified Colwellia TaxID=196834 RepID=UPI0015F6DBE5|nr:MULTISPECIES: formate dehydrogenase subunit alpha [unclassified Colwellia]MBA6234022.1 formate dehydrogenase subunit alpha [Colwellia sp. MB02u-7]MBA6238056.1 formate dehydrogenase subunit alpha [Colwellia sp. MB02u-11]MBA6300696.1 formate dehydrogenase subunit alpha [Colwellia sp. MB3u-22]MBA6311405.1 formate dehydrogenase subunit alpha [Colwellia sp. MB3u-64]